MRTIAAAIHTGRPPRLALAIATGAGSGYAPIAPGTWGSLVGVALFVGAFALSPLYWAITWLALCALGVWSAGIAEQWFNQDDDGRIVIDEIAGQLLGLAPLIFFRPGAFWPGVVTGFVAFRVLDIWKPGPVRWAERRFEGGAGVMADDLVAGALAAVLVAVLGSVGVLEGLAGIAGSQGSV